MTSRSIPSPLGVPSPEILTGVVLAGGKSSRMGQDKRGMWVRDDCDMLSHTLNLLSACTDRVVISCGADSVPECAKPECAKPERAKGGAWPVILDALPEGPLAPAQTTPPHLREPSPNAGNDPSRNAGNDPSRNAGNGPCCGENNGPSRSADNGPSRSADNGIGPLAGMYASLKSLGGPLLVLSCDLPFMTEAVLHRLIAARNAAQAATPVGGLPPLMTTFRQAETGFIEALVAIYEADALPLFEQAILSGVRKLNMVIPEARREDVFYTRDEAIPFFNVNYPADLALARRAILSHKDHP